LPLSVGFLSETEPPTRLEVDTEKEARVTKQDALLLNLSSALGVVFSILSATIGGIEAVILFLPFLGLGWYLPIRLGYVSGALGGSLENKIRGWICLVIGAMAYIMFACCGLFFVFLPQLAAEIPNEYIIFVILGGATLIGLVPTALWPRIVSWGKRISEWISGVHKQRPTLALARMSQSTIYSMMVISLGLVIVFTLPLRYTWGAPDIFEYVVGNIGMSLPLLFWGAIFYVDGGRWVAISRASANLELVSQDYAVPSFKKRTVAWLVKYVPLIVLIFLTFASPNTVNLPLPTLAYEFWTVSIFSLHSFRTLPDIKKKPEWDRVPESERKRVDAAIHWIEQTKRLSLLLWP